MTTLVAQTIVAHGDRTFKVSTINRECSAAAAHGHIYAETLVWELFEDGQLGPLEYQTESSASSLGKHISIVREFAMFGKMKDGERP